LQLGAPNEPEVGAMLKTSGNAINHAAGLVGTAGTMITAYSDWKSSFMGKNIAEVAGVPSPIKGFDAFEHFRAAGTKAITGIIDSAEGLAGTLKTWREDSKKKAVSEVVELEKALVPEGEKYEDTRRSKVVKT